MTAIIFYTETIGVNGSCRIPVRKKYNVPIGCNVRVCVEVIL